MPSTTSVQSAREKLIVALDVPTLKEAKELAERLHDQVGMFKIGLELYAQHGTEVFSALKAYHRPIFFDCKFMDIPNTVARASRNLVGRDIQIFNLHATGGAAMMRATAEAVRDEAQKKNVPAPKIIAVTILTSLSDDALKNELGWATTAEAAVERLAQLTRDCGLDGVVASAQEAAKIRKLCGKEFLIITPGVRPEWSAADDQARTLTPAQAIANGADYLVVGRPITRHASPSEAAQRVVEEIASQL